MNLSDALRYAKATAADYHKAFERLAGDHTGSFDQKAVFPVEDFGRLLRLEGHHPQADFIDSSLAGTKALGEPPVIKVDTRQFPEKHRERFDRLEPGDFYLHLDRPQGDQTHAVLFQKSLLNPHTAYGWLDSIVGSPEEVRAEVERLKGAGVAVDLGSTVKPLSEDYDLWQKHFGLYGEGEEELPEEYRSAQKALRYINETHADFKRAIHANPQKHIHALVYADWLEEQGKPAHAGLIRKHVEENDTGATLFADPSQEPTPVLRGDETAFDSDPLPYPQIRLHLHTPSSEGGNLGWSATVPHTEWEQWEKKLQEEGSFSIPFHFPQVPIEFGDAPLHFFGTGQYKTLEKALKYINETHADFHNKMMASRTDPVRGVQDKVTPLVYADWLEENGKPAHAEVIRRHVAVDNGGVASIPQVPFHLSLAEKEVGQSEAEHLNSGAHHCIRMQIAGPLANISWMTPYLPVAEAKRLITQLKEEGATEPDNTPLGYRKVGRIEEPTDPVSEHFSATERPIRYSAVPSHEHHPDYTPNGVAPRIGSLLSQLALEDSDTGALAEGILRTGSHDALPILADRLQEMDHPLAQEIDWRHAPRAIRIDRALHREIGRRQVRHPDGHRVPLSAGWVIADAEEGIARPALSRRKALFHARLAQPDATSEDVMHSLFRLLYDRAAAEEGENRPIPDYQRELTKARLQRLGHRPLDPFRYTDLRSEQRRKYKAEKVRYSHQAFQQAVAKDPSDWTSSLIYADFLNEKEMPNHAEVVRAGAKTRQDGWGMLGQSRELSPTPTSSDFAVSAEPLSHGKRWLIALLGREKSETGHRPAWYHTVDPETAKGLIEGLLREGAENHITNPLAVSTLLPTKNAKYAAYRAPAGGMVVKQSPLAVSGQWAEGGEFVNDLQKLPTEPVDYKKDRKRKKRLVVEYLRKRFRGRVYGGTATDTVTEGGGEGE